jgi:hypothetical protein
MRLPDLSMIPDMAQPDGILACPSRGIAIPPIFNVKGARHAVQESNPLYSLMNALVQYLKLIKRLYIVSGLLSRGAARG